MLIWRIGPVFPTLPHLPRDNQAPSRLSSTPPHTCTRVFLVHSPSACSENASESPRLNHVLDRPNLPSSSSSLHSPPQIQNTSSLTYSPSQLSSLLCPIAYSSLIPTCLRFANVHVPTKVSVPLSKKPSPNSPLEANSLL